MLKINVFSRVFRNLLLLLAFLALSQNIFAQGLSANPASSSTGDFTLSWPALNIGISFADARIIETGPMGTFFYPIQDTQSTLTITGRNDGAYEYDINVCVYSEAPDGGECYSSSDYGIPKAVVTVNIPVVTTPTSFNVPANSLNGSYTVSWSVSPIASSYEIQRQINSGEWVNVQNSSATSYSESGLSDATYSYRVRACEQGCSAWTGTQSTVVTNTPIFTSAIGGANTDTNGNFTLSWTAASGSVTYYTLQRSQGSWQTIQQNTNLSRAESGLTDGNYSYRVQACNSLSCSSWSSTKTVQVLSTPSTPGAINVASASTGSHSLSWASASGTVDSYDLQRRVNGGAWASLQSSLSTNAAESGLASGSYDYRVQACNVFSCSAWTSVATVQVDNVAGTPGSITGQSFSTTGNYTLSWGAASGAVDSYALERRASGGSWVARQNTNALSVNELSLSTNTYEYRVQACNSSACSAWTSVHVVDVVLAPGIPSSITVSPTTSTDGNFTITWGASSGAASAYELERQDNGGAWSNITTLLNSPWTYTDTGLVDGVYTYRVRGCHTLGSTTNCSAYATAAPYAVSVASNSPPSLTINEPLAGSQIISGAPVAFLVAATDVVDGDLSNSVQWNSNIDGLLGTGDGLIVSSLTVGTHTITASVANSASLSSLATTSLTVLNAGSGSAGREVFNGTFDSVGDTQGFVYLDDVFRNSVSPNYASGNHVVDSSCDNGGCLYVELAGIDGNNITHMSGAWQKSFTLSTGESASITFRYFFDQGSNYEPSEFSEAIFSVDGLQIGTPGNDYLFHVAGDGDGGVALSTNGWITETFDLGELGAGTHTIEIGAYNNYKTSAGEFTSMWIDDVVLTASGGVASNTAPSINITAPANDSSFIQGQNITFISGADDAEDGDLSALIQWDSNLDGNLGFGGSLNINSLSVGSHQITANVADSSGAASSDILTLTVNATVNNAPSVSISSPTPGSALIQGSTASFMATANDIEDGDLSALIQWSSNLDGNLGSGGSINVNNLSLGSHQITASATDQGSVAGSGVLTLTINATINNAPTIAITQPLAGSQITVGNSVTFSVSATDVIDGDLSSNVQWVSNIDGLFGVGNGVTVNSLSVGTHTINASVVNSSGLSALASTSLTVVNSGSGSGSGSREVFNGTFDSAGDTQGFIYLDDVFRNSASPNYASGNHVIDSSCDNGGCLYVELAGIDGNNITDMSGAWQKNFTLSAGESASITFRYFFDQGSNYEPSEFSEAIFSVDGVQIGTQGNDYLFHVAGDGDGGIALSTNGWVTETFDLGQLGAGTHTIEIGAYNNYKTSAGEFTSMWIDDVVLTATGGAPSNTAPSVNILAPTGSSSFPLGQTVVFSAMANDAEDGDLSSVIQWSSNLDGNLGSGGLIYVSNLSLGAHQVTANITDSSGTTGSDVLTLNVTAASNTAPTVSISTPASGSMLAQGSTATFTATASDPEDGDLSTSVQWNSDINGFLGSGNPLSTSFLSEGSHLITASVTDSFGFTDSQQINITVTASAPATPGAINVPSSDDDGIYNLSWGVSPGSAASYELQRKTFSGAWATVQNNSTTSRNESGLAEETYSYRVRACSTGVCSSWTGTAVIAVILPPGIPSSISGPSSNSTGNYNLSWSASSGIVTSFNLQEQVDSGNWSTIQNANATSLSLNKKLNTIYSYRVQACNSLSCSGWSPTKVVDVSNLPLIFASNTPGSLPQSLSVGHTGHLNVSIPINVPSGVNGLQPAIALSYKTLVKNVVNDVPSTIGHGWELSGFPAVHSCNEFHSKFCYGDKKLIAEQSGEQLTTGNTFRLSDNPNVRFTVMQNGGLKWFLMQLGDRKFRFGNTGVGNVIRGTQDHWYLEEVEDAFGNRMNISYLKPNANKEIVPATISYGGYEVIFDYGVRQDLDINNAGSVALKSIQTFVNNTLVGQYSLRHELENGLNLFKEIQYCGADQQGTNLECLPSTKFAWTDIGTEETNITPQAVNQVIDGLNRESNITYLSEIPIENASAHGFEEDPSGLFGIVLPTCCEGSLGIFQYVASISQSDGIGGESEVQYAYDLKYKFLNHANHIRESLPDGSYNYRLYGANDYSDKFIYKGRFKDIFVQGGASTLISESFFNWNEMTFNPTGSQSVDPDTGKKAESKYFFLFGQYSVNADENGNIGRVSSSTSNPTWNPSTGLVDGVTQITSEGFGLNTNGTVTNIERTTKTTTVHDNDVANWLIGFVSDSQVEVYDIPNEPGIKSISTQRQALPGYQTLVAGSSTGFIGTNLEFTNTINKDSFGNTISISASGPSFSTRSQQVNNFLDNRYAQSTINAKGHEALIDSYDLRFGTPITISDPNGLQGTVARDNFGQVIQGVLPNGAIINTSTVLCDASCNVVEGINPTYKTLSAVSHPFESFKGQPDTVAYFDQLGRVLRTETEGFNAGEWVKVDTAYDDLGRAYKVSRPYINGSPRFSFFAYDELSRLTRVDNPDGSWTTKDYESFADRQRLITTNHSVGNGGAKSQVRVEDYNSLGQLIQSYDAFGTADQVLTEYDYDHFGNNDWVRINGDDNTIVLTEFDLAGNMLAIDDPNTGRVDFTYNALGQVENQTDARNITTQFSYDLLGRLTQKIDDINGVAPTINTWQYDTQKIGLLSSISGSGFTESYQYNNLVQLETIDSTINISGFNNSYTTALTYDGYGRVLTKNNPSGLITVNEYNNRGYSVAQYKDSLGGALISRIDSTDALGNIAQTTVGNGIVTTQTFNQDTGLLQNKIADGGAIQNLSFDWWSDGTLYQRAQVGNNNATEIFNYDNLNRLQSATTNHSGGVRNISYDYDALGNLQHKTDNTAGNQVTGYNYAGDNKPHRLNSVQINGVSHSYNYDVSGNLTFDDATGTANDRTIIYNAIGKPSLIKKGDSSNPSAQSTFIYGPDGSRFYQENLQGDKTIYLFGGGVEINLPANGNIQSVEKTYLGAAIHIRETSILNSVSERMEYTHTDHLGSITAITDENGNPVQQKNFDPFGSYRTNSWSGLGSAASSLDQLIHTSRGYTGHEQLDNVGLIHMNGRVYDPVVGRFVSADPIVQAPTFSQSYNRYAYVFNSPLSFVDPSGYEGLSRPWGERTPIHGLNPNGNPELALIVESAYHTYGFEEYTAGNLISLQARSYYAMAGNGGSEFGGGNVGSLFNHDYGPGIMLAQNDYGLEPRALAPALRIDDVREMIRGKLSLGYEQGGLYLYGVSFDTYKGLGLEPQKVKTKFKLLGVGSDITTSLLDGKTELAAGNKFVKVFVNSRGEIGAKTSLDVNIVLPIGEEGSLRFNKFSAKIILDTVKAKSMVDRQTQRIDSQIYNWVIFCSFSNGGCLN